ncbi:MAG: hypothetical protein NTW87_12085 [Planctomycetota bacterium]|nr:hypothetical protein [Planctomycetota bacterium]
MEARKSLCVWATTAFATLLLSGCGYDSTDMARAYREGQDRAKAEAHAETAAATTALTMWGIMVPLALAYLLWQRSRQLQESEARAKRAEDLLKRTPVQPDLIQAAAAEFLFSWEKLSHRLALGGPAESELPACLDGSLPESEKERLKSLWRLRGEVYYRLLDQGLLDWEFRQRLIEGREACEDIGARLAVK